MQPITQSIFANNNMAIHVAPGSWQLFVRMAATESVYSTEPAPLVQAAATGLTYQANFAEARNLPNALLPHHQIETVVVGWERKDGCWHLGLLFTADLAQTRGGRWCGLARWSDPTGLIEFQAAELAGRALADTIHRPFRLVTDQLRTDSATNALPPASDSAAAAITAGFPSSFSNGAEALTAAETDIPLEPPKLTGVVQSATPVIMGDWMLAENENGLIWQRSRTWRNGMTIRTVIFAVLTLLFFVLSIGGLSSIFAPVQPDWLPLVGLVVAVVLVINAGFHLMRLYSAGTVEFDQRLQMVRWQQPGKGVIRQVPFEKVQYILASHTVLRTEKLKGTTPSGVFDQLNLEIWLHVARDIGDFVEFGHVVPVEGRGVHQVDRQPRHTLDLTELDTPVHHAAQLIATAMNVPAFVEQRI